MSDVNEKRTKTIKLLIEAVNKGEHRNEDIKNAIANREKLGLDSTTITDLILLTGDLEYIKENMLNAVQLYLTQEDKGRLSLFISETSIDLPKEMRIKLESVSNGELVIDIIRNHLRQQGLNWYD